MTTFDRIKNLADKQKISLKTLAANLGFSENYFYNMKNSKSSPSSDVLAKVAKYFNVSVDYLLGLDDKTPIDRTIDLAEIANKPKDFDWDSFLSLGGKPIPEEDKELIRRLFAHKLSDD